MKNVLLLICLCSLFVFAGCNANYTTPGAGVDLQQLQKIDDYDIREQFKTKPMASFPANIAIVRIQQDGYYSRSCQSYGRGAYSVVLTRDAEQDTDFEKLVSLPQVAGIGPLNRLLLPQDLNSVRDLRMAAAKLHADMLLLYTIDTSFVIDSAEVGPLGVISLGTIPNRSARVTSTASAVFYDVRTGYIYGLAEGSHTQNKLASFWSEDNAVEAARIKTEQQAFTNLVDELCKTWKNITIQYVTPE